MTVAVRVRRPIPDTRWRRVGRENRPEEGREGGREGEKEGGGEGGRKASREGLKE